MNEQNNNFNLNNVGNNSQPVNPVMPQPVIEPQQPVMPQPMVEPQQPVIPQPVVEPQQPVIPQPVVEPQQPVMTQPVMSQPVMSQPIIQPQEPVMPQPMMQPQEPVVANKEKHTKKSNKKMIFVIIGAVIAVLVAVLLYIFVFSGKTLTCTVDEENIGMVISAELKMKFKGNEVSKADINMAFDLGDYASYKDEMLEQIEEQYSDDEFKNMGVKVTSDDTKIYVNMEATKQTFKAAGFSTEGTYKEVKEDLEQQGFTCK